MKSMQHVLWRGALALALMVVGVGSGISLPATDAQPAASACVGDAPALLVHQQPLRDGAPRNPAGAS